MASSLRLGQSLRGQKGLYTLINRYPVFRRISLQLITLLYGGDFSLFRPGVPMEDETYELEIMTRQCEFFGPYPQSYQDFCPPDTSNILAYIMESIPTERKMMFKRISKKELSRDDKEFILKIMKLDPRDRPSAGSYCRLGGLRTYKHSIQAKPKACQKTASIIVCVEKIQVSQTF